MNIETLDRAIEIKKEITTLEKEIQLLPVTTHRRTLKRVLNGILKKNYNELYVVDTCTYNKEVIVLDNDDINCLINLKQHKINVLKEELKNLILSLTPEELEKAVIIFQEYLLTTQVDPPLVPPTYCGHNLTVPFERSTARH